MHPTRLRHGVLIVGVLAGALARPVAAHSQGEITYVYDDLGRLTGVVNQAGESASYSYDAVGNLLAITRGAAGAVSIIQLNPSHGPVGTEVRISGTGFSTTPSQNVVSFGGVIASVLSSTATQIVATVPSAAITGPVSVVAPLGSAISPTPFTVTTVGPPTISGFSPAIGTPGTGVTVTGANFDTTAIRNQLTFNTISALATSASPTSLTAATPQASSGKISVATAYGRATSAADYFVAPPPYGVADIQVTDRMGVGSMRTINIGTPGKIGLVVFDAAAGQRVSLRATNLGVASADLSVIRPDAGLAVDREFADQVSGGFIDATPLNVDGTYTILVDPNLNYTGSLDLTLYNVPPDVSTSIAPDGSPVGITTTTPGQNARLTFSGTSGQRISLKASGVSITSSDISILKPGGMALGGGTFVDTFGAFREPDSLPGGGAYTVIVDPTEYYTGSMTLTMYDVPPDISSSVTIDGPSASVSPAVPGQNARVTFQVTNPGEQLKLRMTGVTISSSTVYVLKPNGAQLGSAVTIGTSGGTIFRTPQTAGTYTIVVDSDHEYTGSMTLTLTSTP